MTRREHPALAGLDDVRWDAVQHAYGPANDVPALLRELVGTREEQEHALHELYGNIWHQGTVYEATSHAVPFLVGLALAEAPPLRDELLGLLADIAMGSSYLDVHQHYLRGGLSSEEHVAMRSELGHLEAARAAVLESVPRLLEKVMSERTPGGLCLVARLAAAFPDEKEVFADALQWMWENAEDIRVRAALGIAFARRAEDAGYWDGVLSDLFEDLHERPQASGP